MATQERELLETTDLAGLSHEQLLRFYRTMVTSRRIDDREMSLKRQNKVFFQISGAGHEAVGVAVAEHCVSGQDWFYPYYRDRAMMLALGQTALDHLLQAVGAEADPASGGRQMPAHYGDKRFNVPSSSSPTGTQFLQAVGAAEAGFKANRVPGLSGQISPHHENEIVVVCTGDGATSEGEFFESLNTACNLKLPVVYVVQDTGYAISVPIEVQTAGGSISRLVSGFPGLHIVECDGTDVVDTYRAAAEATSLPILAEIIAYGQIAGPDATLHERPAQALQLALKRANLEVDDIDLFEINEAFASVAMWSTHLLGINHEQVNVHGGAVALGQNAPAPVDGRRRAQALGEGPSHGGSLSHLGQEKVGSRVVADPGGVRRQLKARDRRQVGKGGGRKR